MKENLFSNHQSDIYLTELMTLVSKYNTHNTLQKQQQKSLHVTKKY